MRNSFLHYLVLRIILTEEDKVWKAFRTYHLGIRVLTVAFFYCSAGETFWGHSN